MREALDSRNRYAHVGAALMAVVFFTLAASAAHKAAEPAGETDAVILVVDNADSDFKKPPFNDTVLLLSHKGETVKEVGGLNVCQEIGSNRLVAVSDDGSFFVVCENVADKITAYETTTAKVLWSLHGPFRAAAISGGTVYALQSAGTIYGSGLVAINKSGKIVNRSKAAGFDIAVDPDANCLWLVGGDIKKCDMNLNVLWSIDPIEWCASSVDLNQDGSAWVAERRHDQAGGQNRLLKISPKGVILQIIPLKMSPVSVRTDRSDAALWTTGVYVRKTSWPTIRWRGLRPALTKKDKFKLTGFGSSKFSALGEPLVQLKEGGWSLDLDPSDGSVWIAGTSRLLKYSREGRKLGTYRGLSKDQKWISIIPRESKPPNQLPKDAP